MDVWPDLRTTLLELAGRDPSPLRAWPSLSPKPHRFPPPPPHAIWLSPWAADVAADLHRRYGAGVRLRLGALRYPERTAEDGWERPRGAALPIDAPEVPVALDGPLSVRSGHAATSDLLVGNRTSGELAFATGPCLLADVVDPTTGDIVGGQTGIVDAVRREFVVPAGGTTRVPLLVATDSFDADLGYAVPPGDWGIQVTLGRVDGPSHRTRVLPLTVTA